MHGILSQLLLLLLTTCLQFHIICAVNERGGLNNLIKEENQKVGSDAEDYLTNGKYYTPSGNLIYYGVADGFSDILTMFFKGESFKCSPYFKITFCVNPARNQSETSTCPNGITMCYDSQITASYLHKEYHEIKIKQNKNPSSNCKNTSHMALKVSTDIEGEKFIITSSLDTHEYIFAMPENISAQDPRRCFDLNMGSSDSVATTISKTNDKDMKSLYSTGTVPKDFEKSKSFTYQDTEKNLWMLFADFMPYYSNQSVYYARPIQFTGGGSECALSAEFNADSMHICKRNSEFIGACEPQELDSSDVECTVELGNSESQEEEDRKESSKTEGTSHKEVQVEQNTIGVGLRAKYGYDGLVHSFEAEVSVNYQRTWGTNIENERSSSGTNSESKALKQVFGKEKRVTMKIHRTDGGVINFFQEVLQCGGKTLRYHKIIAKGDAEHSGFPQSTTVYEWRNDSAVPNYHLTIHSAGQYMPSMGGKNRRLIEE